MRRWIFKGVLVVVVVGGFLAGIVGLGHLSREQIRQRDRYRVAFTDIDCQPPEGMERVAFLDEVRYEAGPKAGIPESFCILDDDLRQRLATAFRCHPWVERVLAVELTPPKQVRVELVYRQPVLAVKDSSIVRAVDGNGVLLPRTAVTAGLPVYRGKAAPPAGPAGTRWGDAAVEAMARSLRKAN